jgi:hypothetical protein
MNSARSTPAGDTTAILQQAAQSGLPVLIPGAFEKRAGRPAARPASAGAAADRPHVRAAADTRGQLEREREGGGAPRERRPPRNGTILARCWHGLFHPADLPMIWRRPLRQER